MRTAPTLARIGIATSLAVLCVAATAAGANSATAQAHSKPSGTSQGADAPVPNYHPAANNPVGKIGTERITEKDVIAEYSKDFQQQQESQALKLRQLQLEQAQERYLLLKDQADKMLDKRALELESKATGRPVLDLVKDIKTPAVTDEEVQQFYEARKGRTSQTLDQLRADITQYLASAHDTEAKRRFYDDLRAKHHIESTLEPYRLSVAANGPARGKSDARVTIVEFADFQCPYCREAEDTLRIITGMHPNDVRVVFRQLPLASIHPNALIAARAGVCADQQHMFWPMHDAMYGNQEALGESGLKDTAKRLGMDSDAFSSCLSAEDTAKPIFSDVKAADELNIGSTPFFFINGRPVKGSVPVDQFETVVAEELQRAAPNRG
jgi:protein-disulfide isomerase